MKVGGRESQKSGKLKSKIRKNFFSKISFLQLQNYSEIRSRQTNFFLTQYFFGNFYCSWSCVCECESTNCPQFVASWSIISDQLIIPEDLSANFLLKICHYFHCHWKAIVAKYTLWKIYVMKWRCSIIDTCTMVQVQTIN